MSLPNKSYRAVLADFVFQIPENKAGWWYRLPQQSQMGSNNATSTTLLMTDTIMPHFGSVFGLTELAMSIILIEMDLVKQNKQNRHTINTQGWLDLKTEFGLQNKIEISQFRASSKEDSSKRQKATWYIKLGVPSPDFSTPEKIWRKFPTIIKCSPRSINSRATLNFVVSEFTKILKTSERFLDILQNYSGSVTVQEWNQVPPTHTQTTQEVPMMENATSELDICSEEEEDIQESSSAIVAQSDLTSGELLDPNQFPLLHKLGITKSHHENLAMLHREMVQLLQANEEEADHNLRLPVGFFPIPLMDMKSYF